jgi:hypothetical protein
MKTNNSMVKEVLEESDKKTNDSYYQLMKDAGFNGFGQEWQRNGDFFVKFTLYDNNRSIASTNTINTK